MLPKSEQQQILWKLEREIPELSDGEIHIWAFNLDENAGEAYRFLEALVPQERERSSRFFFLKDRLRWAVGRAMLRLILGRYSGTAPCDISFELTSTGKPRLHDGLEFNLSHSEGGALLAVTRAREVGIDLEFIRPVPEALEIAERFFAPSESRKLFNLPPGDQPRGFFELWTRKEAYLKCCGQGITESLNQVEVNFGTGSACKILSIEQKIDRAADWNLHDLRPFKNSVAALAYKGLPAEVKEMGCEPAQFLGALTAKGPHTYLRS